MRTLVIGGGQLGRGLRRAFGAEASILPGVPWSSPAPARERLQAEVRAFLERAGDDPWALLWSAGAGVVGSDASGLAVERSYLAAVLAAVEADPRRWPTGRVFVASSAGGVYGEVAGIEATERTVPAPVSDYGRSKLRQDEAVAAWVARTNVPTLIGRISNLYGPDQQMHKPQGFISHLCASIADRGIFTLTVPSHTMRDFVYADDVAARVAAWAGADPAPRPAPVVKILATQRSVTLARVIGVARAVTHAHARVVFASRPSSALQPRSLRFRSVELPELDELPTTPLEVGVRAVWLAVSRARARAAAA